MKFSEKTAFFFLAGFFLFSFYWGFAFAGDLKIGTWKTPQTIQPFFYEYFLPETCQAEIFNYSNLSDQKTALLAGCLDMCAATLVYAIQSASKGQPVVVVAALCNKSSGLVVRKTGKVFSVNDLKGKKIGYVPGTMDEILLRETLNKNNIYPEKDVSLIRINFFDMGMALSKGGIDAFLSGEPFPTLALEKGDCEILSYPYYDEPIGTINSVMIVTRKSIDENQEMICQLVNAHALATKYLIENKDEWLKKAAEFGTPVTVLEKAASNIELAWEIDETYVSKVRALGQRMEALGMIDAQPEYETLFDLSFVKQVKDNPEHASLPQNNTH